MRDSLLVNTCASAADIGAVEVAADVVIAEVMVALHKGVAAAMLAGRRSGMWANLETQADNGSLLCLASFCSCRYTEAVSCDTCATARTGAKACGANRSGTCAREASHQNC
jgi:hypothetical protein